ESGPEERSERPRRLTGRKVALKAPDGPFPREKATPTLSERTGRSNSLPSGKNKAPLCIDPGRGSGVVR
ncbi:unnamed protein product, partial [Ostreobium quekettii]